MVRVLGFPLEDNPVVDWIQVTVVQQTLERTRLNWSN
ncbi:unnamed protein product [Tuwongella immobilis]|uniref:Uncharacterized protein n=1 Tax=Tuwongella immobilis TaxID=692036 RepID=A0A6C2YHG7_9BACT|nr:unnamed protein product [Tuwongella immobilis]VTR97026.1 unnamed protein product [Tuwongella immobilis]